MRRFIKYMTASGRIIGDYVTDEFVPTQTAGMGLMASDIVIDPDAQYIVNGAVASRVRRMLVGKATAGEKATVLNGAGVFATVNGLDVPVSDIDCPVAGDIVYPLAGSYVGDLRITVAPVMSPAEVEASGVTQIDDLAKSLAMTTMTGGFIKAQMYEEQSREVVLYQSLKGTILTLTTATAQFPALMAMVAEWNPEATTDAAKIAALPAMVAKVQTGIAQSRPYLRRLNAIAVRGKEQLRAAPTAAGKRAVIAAVTAKLTATPAA